MLFVCMILGICGGPVTISAASPPPGAPMEDVRYANEWPSPNGDLYNTRVAHSTISSANVSKLGVAWTLPLTGTGATGADVANPVIADGIAYLQDGASNVDGGARTRPARCSGRTGTTPRIMGRTA